MLLNYRTTSSVCEFYQDVLLEIFQPLVLILKFLGNQQGVSYLRLLVSKSYSTQSPPPPVSLQLQFWCLHVNR